MHLQESCLTDTGTLPPEDSAGRVVLCLQLIRGGRDDMEKLLGGHPRERVLTLAELLRSGTVAVEDDERGALHVSFSPDDLENLGRRGEEEEEEREAMVA